MGILRARILNGENKAYNFFILGKARAVKYHRRQRYKGRWVYDYGEADKRTHTVFRKKKIDLLTPKKLASVKVKEGTKWWNAMMPEPKQYEKIQNGDKTALGEYVMAKFWKSADPNIEDGGMKVNDLVKNIPRSPIVGFGYEDVAQETFIDLMEAQEKGYFKNVPINKFPSNVSTFFKNAGSELYRENKIDKEAYVQIEDLEKKIKLATSTAEEVSEHKALQELASNIVDTISKDEKMNPRFKEVFFGWVRGESYATISKNTGMAIPRARSIMSREIGNTINRILSKNRMNINWKDLKEVFRKYIKDETKESDIERARRIMGSDKIKVAAFRIVNGRLLMKAKPAEVGALRTHGGVKVRKEASGKWVPVSDGKEKVKPDAEGKKGVKPVSAYPVIKEYDERGAERKKEDKSVIEGLKGEKKKKMREQLKDGIKNFIEMITDMMAGRGPEEKAIEMTARQATIERGKKEIMKRRKEEKKRAKQEKE